MLAQTERSELWKLVLGRMYLSPQELADAVCLEANEETLDFRTRLLIRDSVRALQRHWDSRRLQQCLEKSKALNRIEAICNEDLGPPGFPYLVEQLVEPMRKEDIENLFRDLGARVHSSLTLFVGGSIALIVPGYLLRRTQDVDIVDEVPREIREMRPVLDSLMKRYQLRLAHFASHYLPAGWQQRVHSLGSFGRMQVFLVDMYDVCLSKICSKREKDLDDLRALRSHLDKARLTEHMRLYAGKLLAETDFQSNATRNWYILYGEPLPK